MERLLALLRKVPLLPAPNHGQNLQQPVHVDDLDLTPFQRTLARLDTEVSGVFPWDLEAAEDAMHRGVPVSRLYPRSPFTQKVRAYLAPVLERSRKAPEPKERPGLLARLFGREA